MSSHNNTIRVIANGKSATFNWLLEKLKEVYPKKTNVWRTGVAVHIKCQCDGKGHLEYQDNKWDYKTWPIPFDKRTLCVEQIATIREKTIEDKYERYMAQIRMNRLAQKKAHHLC